MILKAKHLYRAASRENHTIFTSYGKKYVLICPQKDVDVNYDFRDTIKTFVQVDILDCFQNDSSIYLTNNAFEFKSATVSDILEIIQRMKEMKECKYRYDFRTNEIVPKNA